MPGSRAAVPSFPQCHLPPTRNVLPNAIVVRDSRQNGNNSVTLNSQQVSLECLCVFCMPGMQKALGWALGNENHPLPALVELTV